MLLHELTTELTEYGLSASTHRLSDYLVEPRYTRRWMPCSMLPDAALRSREPPSTRPLFRATTALVTSSPPVGIPYQLITPAGDQEGAESASHDRRRPASAAAQPAGESSDGGGGRRWATGVAEEGELEQRSMITLKPITAITVVVVPRFSLLSRLALAPASSRFGLERVSMTVTAVSKVGFRAAVSANVKTLPTASPLRLVWRTGGCVRPPVVYRRSPAVRL
jgi:hypothetical protein